MLTSINVQKGKCMKTMIDTNILYNLAGVNKSEKKAMQILTLEMEKFKPLYISELTLLELLTHESFSDIDLKNIFDYIKKNGIICVNYSSDSLDLKNLSIDFNNQSCIEYQKAQALSKKILIETETLPMVIVSAVVVMAIFYEKKTTNDETNIKLIKHLNSLIEGNIVFIKSFCKETVVKYYQNKNNTQFKNDVKDLILVFLYILSISYQLSENGLLLSDLGIDDQNQIDKSTFNKHQSPDFITPILAKFKGKNTNGLFGKKVFWAELTEALSSFFKTLQIELNPGIINYYSLYIKNMFISDAKFDKNNLIDSLFHNYNNSYNFFTLDEMLTESYQVINPLHYKKLIDLQASLKE